MKLAYNSKVLVEGKGSILIKQRDGGHAYIINILYVPVMKNNLLSLG